MTGRLFNKTTRGTVYTILIVGPIFTFFVGLLSLGAWGLIEEPMIVAAIIYFLGCIYSIIKIYIEIIVEGLWESTITINEEGIFMKSKKKDSSIRWENVRIVGIGNKKRAIIFSTNFDKEILKKRILYKHINNDCIFVELREGILKEIENYYEGIIIGSIYSKKRDAWR